MLRPPLKQPRAHETKLHILLTAAELYVLKKQEVVQMSQIARSANISQGAIYRYFANLPELWHFAAHTSLEKSQNLANQIFASAARDPEDLMDKWVRLFLALCPLRRESQGLLAMSRLFIYGVDPMPYASLIKNHMEEWNSRFGNVFVQCGATKDEENALLRWVTEQYLTHFFLCPTGSNILEDRRETQNCAERLQSLLTFKGIA